MSRTCARCGGYRSSNSPKELCYECRYEELRESKQASKSSDWYTDEYGNLTRLHGDV